MQITIELTDDQLDELARRVADHLSAGKPEPWIDVAATAEYLDCDKRRIYTLVSQGRIPHTRDGKRLLFRRSDLDAWLVSSHLVSTPAPIPLPKRVTGRRQVADTCNQPEGTEG